MRTLLFCLAAVTITATAHAQSQGETLVEFRRQINAAPERVEAEVGAVADARRSLREVTPVGDPTLLVTGDAFLQICGSPFVLYLRSTNHHTDVRLESRSFEVSRAARERAKAFLQAVADRSTAAQEEG